MKVIPAYVEIRTADILYPAHGEVRMCLPEELVVLSCRVSEELDRLSFVITAQNVSWKWALLSNETGYPVLWCCKSLRAYLEEVCSRTVH